METVTKAHGPGPRKPARRNDGADAENQVQRAAEEEPADIERDIPDVENEPVERDGREDEADSPIFEE